MTLRGVAAFVLATTSAAAAERLPEALAPGLEVIGGDVRPPLSVGAAVSSRRTRVDAATAAVVPVAPPPRRLFVHCDVGSDERDGQSLATAVASVLRARDLLRELRSAAAEVQNAGGEEPAVVVEVRGTCYVETPLTLSAQDAASNSEAPVVWLGRDGAVLSAGRAITQWEAVSWPGAPAGTVLRTDVESWPLDVTSLRLVQPPNASAESGMHAPPPWLGEWIPRTRYPKTDPSNYSKGWLTTAGWTCPTDLNEGNMATSSKWSIGIESSVPKAVLAEPTNLYFNGWGVGSWSRAGSSGEKDVLNQISRAVGFQTTSPSPPAPLKPPPPTPPAPPGPALIVPLAGGTIAAARYFLENARSSLSEGEFYMDHGSGSLYVWPRPEWGGATMVAVAPVATSVVELRGAHNHVFSNISFRDAGYSSVGCWCGAASEPDDATIKVVGSHNVVVEACRFLPGLAGYAVSATDAATGLRVIGNQMLGLGQGGVILWGNLTAVGFPGNSSQPSNATIAWNFLKDGGHIIKHVAGAAFRAASHSVISHNHFENLPRYGIEVDTFMPTQASLHNLIEHNVLISTNEETSDTGAIEIDGGLRPLLWPDHSQSTALEREVGFHMNNTIRYNNVTRTLGASAMDGVHVCQHGDNKGSLPGAGTGCRGMTVAIYLDGGSGFGSGTSGIDIYGNVLDCSTAGGLWINGGGDVNFTNNIVINRAILPGFDPGDDGPFWGAITMWSYNGTTNYGRPGNRFYNNIFQMDQTGQPVPVYGGNWFDVDKSPTPMSPDFTRWAGSDGNVFWSRAGAAVANSPSFPGKSSFAQWKQQTNTSLPPDQHSQVADPLFSDPDRGDYSLQPKSPALVLGFKPLPKIAAPTLDPTKDWHPSADLPPPLPPPPPTAGPAQWNEVWEERSVEPGVTEAMNVGPGGMQQLLTVNGSMPLGNGDLTASVFPDLETGAITLWLAKQDALADSSLPFKLGQLSLVLEPNPWAGGDSDYFRQTLDLPTATVEILAGGSGVLDYKAKFEAWIDAESNVAHVTAAAGPAASGEQFKASVRLTSLHPMVPWGTSNAVRCGGDPIPYPPDVLVPPAATGPDWAGIYHRNRPNSTLLNSVLDEQGLAKLRDTAADPRQHGVQLANRTFGFAVGGDGFSRQLSADTANSSVLSSSARPHGVWHVAAAALTTTESVQQWTTSVLKLLADGQSNGVWLPSGRDRVRTTAHWGRFWGRSHIDIKRAPMPASLFPSASPEETGFAVSQRYALARYTHAVQQRPLQNFSMPIKFNGQAFTAQLPNHNKSAPCNAAYDGCVEYRQWGPYDYWQNVRLPYYTLTHMGDFDVLRTAFEYYLQMLPLAEARTQTYFQHGGIFFAETKTLFGTMAGDDYGCNHLTPGATVRPMQLMDSSFMRFDYAGNAGPTEICMLVLDDYLWSRDAEAARRYLPICFKTLEFFMNHYPASSGGGNVDFFPSQALESYQCAMRLVNNSWIDLTANMNLTWTNGKWTGGLTHSNCVLNDAPTVAAMTALTQRLLALPTEFVTQQQRSAWQAYANALPELPRSPDKATFTVYENIDQFPMNVSNSETPQLYGKSAKPILLLLPSAPRRGFG
eukprot:SAG11_NODE_392_length_9837_cov_9.732183_5_plen_1590_part_00